MKRRTKGRELAVKFLYKAELAGEKPTKGRINEYLKSNSSSQDIINFARTLIQGYLRNKKNIDKRITMVSKNWTLERMHSLDRNIIRIGAYELLFCSDVPPAVAINEAIEIAKKFGEEKSKNFVNGILDAINKKFIKPDGDKIST
jgi:N utilization substance protein B